MRSYVSKKLIAIPLAFLFSVFAVGCDQQARDAGGGNEAATVTEALHEGHDHDGWWCVEHAIPEEECSMCSSKAADEFKAKGDWCEEHNRAKSQCFQCDPSRADRFVKLFEAKFGHEPPKPTE